MIGCLLEMPEVAGTDYLPATFKVGGVFGLVLLTELCLFRTEGRWTLDPL